MDLPTYYFDIKKEIPAESLSHQKVLEMTSFSMIKDIAEKRIGAGWEMRDECKMNGWMKDDEFKMRKMTETERQMTLGQRDNGRERQKKSWQKNGCPNMDHEGP